MDKKSDIKILYFGTLCNKDNYEKEISKYKKKPTVAPLIFETALVDGFAQNNAELDIYTFPVFPAFPKIPKLAWGARKEKLEMGYDNIWLRGINITGLKQLTVGISARFAIRKWIRKNKTEKKAVIIYSIYEPIAKQVIKYCKKYRIPCFAVVADLPRDMYNLQQISKIKTLLAGFYTKTVKKVQGQFDGYIYLTKHMSEVINPEAPYIVVEGVAKVSEFESDAGNENLGKRAVMYAGSLNKIYGLDNLIQAFKLLKDSCNELWFFGSGTYEKEIEKYAKEDERIKYFGRKTHEEIVQYERKAALLVNVRDCKEEFTKYSFPSKTIEYMISGTPVLTTKLPGIPEEYFDYVFGIDDNKPQTICDTLTQIFSKSDKELNEFGTKAQEFIAENKNGCVQAKKILKFIEFIFENKNEKINRNTILDTYGKF